jgi:hypothetical protein
MQHMKKLLVLFTVIGLIAAIVVWQWERHEAKPTSLPAGAGVVAPQQQPQGQPAANATVTTADTSEWARRYAARKNVVDVESVTRTFKEAVDCLAYHSARRGLRSVLNDERLDDLSKDTLVTLQGIDADLSRGLSFVRQTEAFCIGSNPDTLEQVYVDAIFTAALMGNPDAQSCFVINQESAPWESASRSAAWAAFLENRYLKYAPVFMQSALERGDPYVAKTALYQYIAGPPVDFPSTLEKMSKADPYLVWRVARLASLRSLPEQRKFLENGLALFKEQNLLQPDDIKRADDWANATYERDFAGQPPINLDSSPQCYSSPDLAP